MPIVIKQCPLSLGGRTLATWVLAVLAVSYSARSSQAGVIVGDDHCIGAMAASNCENRSPQDNGEDRSSPSLTLNLFEAASPAGMDGARTTTAGAPAAVMANLAPASAPQALLVAWLAGGQCPSLPALLPPGLFRPPRCTS